MNEKTALTRRIAAAVRSALTPRRLRYLGTAILAVLAVIAGTSTVSAMSAPVPQRLVIDERAQAQIQRDQALFTAWAITRARGCYIDTCNEPRASLDTADEDYARVAFRRDLAGALDGLPQGFADSLPPVSEWGTLRGELRSRALKYNTELTRQEEEIDELRYPNSAAVLAAQGLPDMGSGRGSCSFPGCTLEEEVERATRWFQYRDFTDIEAWDRAERAGETPEAVAEFIREQYSIGNSYAAAYTLPDEGANDGAVGLWSLLFSVLATGALFLMLSARRTR
ncbi:hypothetical protein [Mycobacteroides abscessus]|uniref:hypothetical protein n=1 Tax=Mycobacteroides abscessus TaxID=36809 RepID=UPI000925CF7A|nr:hypothetical protein [Mycobacteroides abscessus]SHX65351.1 Uncharacterised protein [Mycobacteroides abscessus subsp. abscessus]SHZ17579.1 Uncharacterised protein [Mycobacteroides abscessus subsp. abscessus]SIB51441.1 Uncharacterised protein [Mycobacteroides abscessus subsp. abscessus]SIF17848.1 Uncharacterised protein [Mycobacteroides abscessus subsp. abscessus]SKI47960.1 Uncharacterised protein [Mycobacteroides abscessus subsp. abscessus]